MTNFFSLGAVVMTEFCIMCYGYVSLPPTKKFFIGGTLVISKKIASSQKTIFVFESCGNIGDTCVFQF